MSFFNQKTPNVRCGAVIDIGSGSVGIAIVVSNTETEKLDVVWSHREYMLLKEKTDIAHLEKEINTTIMNALLELGSTGSKALRTYNHQLSIQFIQTALCAPWSYTITKTIQFEDETPIEITKELITELVETAHQEVVSGKINEEVISDLGLVSIHDAVINVELNGYTIENPIGAQSTSVVLSHVSELVSQKIIATIDESIEKILPKAQVTHHSFMYIYYQVLKYLHPDTSEICLIDITNEATEVGIVRDNVLQHVTNTPVGLYSLAREIANVCTIPKEEAYSLLKEGADVIKIYGEEKKTQLETLFGEYESKITEILNDTGDALSIPKTLFIHTSKHTEAFFSERIKNAAKKATGKTHAVHLFTSELLKDKTIDDSALALSVHYFHTKELYPLFLENEK